MQKVKRMRIGIIGTGYIAKRMAETIRSVKDAELYAVASRAEDKARCFAERYGCEKYYGSYEELAKDGAVEMVYIATPHSCHFKNAKLCLENNKPVLVEKPFTVNHAQAQQLLTLSQERNVFITEAMWSRYMPYRQIVETIISKKEIGEVTGITANIGYPMMNVERLLNPDLAGGALLDVGVYAINFALMFSNSDVKQMSSFAVLSSQKIDYKNSVSIEFNNGVLASLYSTMTSVTDMRGVIYGTNGYIVVDNIINPEEINVYDNTHTLQTIYDIPEQITGYEYELISSMQAIQDGKIETQELSHFEILKNMELIDSIVQNCGICYTCI